MLVKEKMDKILSSKKGKIGVAIGVVLILCLGVFISKKVGNNGPIEEMGEVVETYTIPQNEKIFMNGAIKPKVSKSVNADAGYEITTVNVSNGQYVTKGTALFSSKNQEVLSQISDLESQLSSSEDPDSIRSEIKQLKNKSYKTTYAPISGKVYLEEESTDTEMPSAYMTIESVEYYMKGQVSEQDLPKIRSGMEVDVFIFATEQEIKGKISSISDRPSTSVQGQENMGNNSLSYYDVTVEFDSQAGLVNGYHIQASTEVDGTNPKIPSTCVLRDEEGNPFVYKVVGNILEKQIIEIENENEDFIVLRSGLEQNDSIVKFPTEEMNEGDEINSDAGFVEGQPESSDAKVGM